MLNYSKSFIETQFPVSKVSKESYKERKAGASQTLTGLGKWWGRKPLILVRATILGVLMPSSSDFTKDRDIFLKILTMDNSGLWIRKSKNISVIDVYKHLNPKEKVRYFEASSTKDKPMYIDGLTKEEKEYVQELVFNRLSYDEKLIYCDRPEQIKLQNNEVWEEINNHLETNSYTLEELIRELGFKKYGHIPKIGDCFSGGGSIPFEAARIGADVYASDLNPVATLLTWASLNIGGKTQENTTELQKFQNSIFEKVNFEIKKWGIETNEKGHRADTYLYCNEIICPECGYKVPLSPTWTIGMKTKTVAILKDNGIDGFDIHVKENANKAEFKESESCVTVRNGKAFCPKCRMETPISSIRGDKKDIEGNTVYGLRKWEKNDFIPRKTDVFQERLYAIRYIGDKGKYYTAPTDMDIKREQKVVNILNELFMDWQTKGYIPSAIIEDGDETSRLKRERGWQYWHQLSNARQLLINGLLAQTIVDLSKNKFEMVAGILALNKCVDRNSRICRWDGGSEKAQQTFYNQAFNTLFNYVTRGWTSNIDNIIFDISDFREKENSYINILDAREVKQHCDIFITDPPYADAVNYHELTEFFIAWDKFLVEKTFPEWNADSKRILAVKGTGKSFNESMIEIYRNLANHMSDDGTQVVMFTHQDVKVWAELAMILWSAGLRVVSAWNIATETESVGIRNGNYVQGTVTLVLKKQVSNEKAYQDELYDEIKNEVESMIDSMHDLDDKDDPDFTDADYLLASYAASLKVLTAYKEIEGVDVQYWLGQPRSSLEENPIEKLINKAVKIAYDYLIPEEIDKSVWRDLTPDERFFIRGLEVEMNGIYKISSYQELARGFGVKDYTDMFADFKANSARLMTPSEFGMRNLNNGGFSSSLLRHLLVAINECTKSNSTIEGKSYLKSVYQDNNEYWYKKPIMIEVLGFISRIEHVENMTHWHQHSYYAKLLREALKNDGI